MEQLKKAFDASVAQGYTVNASDSMFIVAHECGHALENTMIQKRVAKLGLRGMAAFYKGEAIRKEIGISYYLRAGFTNETYEEILNKIEAELGTRASDTTSEMIAQAVATKFFGIGNHPIADNLVKYLKELLME